MLEMTIRQAMLMMKGKLLNPGADTEKKMPPVSIDSRSIEKSEAFFALVGERLDGHNFLREVLPAGPGLVVLSDRTPLDERKGRVLITDVVWNDNFYDGNLRVPFLQVEDTTTALQDLARGIRELWGGPLIGITGSMGKTTTKYYASRLLKKTLRVHSSSGNFNNHIGLPLSVTTLEDSHQISILELGMNHPGEIRRLSEICRPDTALVTNVAPVHLEFFESIDEIADAKAEIIENIRPGGRLVFNLDDELIAERAADFNGRKITFGFSETADVRITDLEINGIDDTSFKLNVSKWDTTLPLRLKATGKSGAFNLAAAVAATLDYGLEPDMVTEAVPSLLSPEQRGTVRQVKGVTIWDDSYNSNPAALISLLESIRGLEGFGRIILVLGDMLELGERSAELHESCGRAVAESGAAALFTVGKDSPMISRGAYAEEFPADQIFSFASSGEAAVPVKNFLLEDDLLIVKGSRGVKMEAIIDHLKEKL